MTSWDVVLDDQGEFVYGGILKCGRPTAKGIACTQPRKRFRPACWHHVTDTENNAAEIAEKALQFDAFERKVADLGFDTGRPEVRRQMCAWLERERSYGERWFEGLQRHKGNLLNWQQPDRSVLTEERLLVEPLMRLLEEDRIRNSEQARDRLLQKYKGRL